MRTRISWNGDCLQKLQSERSILFFNLYVINSKIIRIKKLPPLDEDYITKYSSILVLIEERVLVIFLPTLSSFLGKIFNFRSSFGFMQNKFLIPAFQMAFIKTS